MSQAERVERLEMMAKADQHSDVMGPWSSGERLAVALVLNRHDWLEAMWKAPICAAMHRSATRKAFVSK